MSSRRSERPRKRPLSIDTQHPLPSLTSLGASFQKPTETEPGETVVDGLATEGSGVNSSAETSLGTPNRSTGRAKGGSVRSRAGTRTRLAAASSGITGNQENGLETIQQHEQNGAEVLYPQQQQANGDQGYAGDDHDAAELKEESEKEDDEEEEDPVWQEFSQEYYEVVEQLPLEIHRNFALLHELDDQTQRQTGQLLEIIRKYVAQRLPSPIPEELQEPLPVLQPDTTTATFPIAADKGEEHLAEEEGLPTRNGTEALQATEQPMDVDVSQNISPTVENESGGTSTPHDPPTQAESQQIPETSKSQPEVKPEVMRESVTPGNQHGTRDAQPETYLDGTHMLEGNKDARSVIEDVASATSIPVPASGDISLAHAVSEPDGNPVTSNGIDNHTTESVSATTTVDHQTTSTDANPPPLPQAEGTQQMQLLKSRHAQMYAQNLVPAMASRALLPEIGKLARDMLRSADEKVGIAMGTYNTVDRHIRSLDAALQAQQAALNLGIRQDTLPSTAITGATITRDGSEPPADSMLQAGGRADAGDLVLGAQGNNTPELKRVGKNWRKGIKGTGPTARAADALNIGVSSSALHHPNSTAAQADVQGGPGMSSKQRGKQKAEPEPIVLGYMAAHKFDMKIDPNEPRYCFCHQVSFGEMLGCENNDCPNGGWFHLSCLGMTKPPAGKWWCDSCKPEDKGSGQKRKKRKIKF